jgi:hypothetical protein
MARYGEFQFDVGNLVQLAGGTRVYTVRWRGWLIEKQSSGANMRQAVYVLDDGYWDAHWETELRSAFRGVD